MKCSWPTGCSNGDVRTFWWYCYDCGRRIRRRSLDRCDYHREVAPAGHGFSLACPHHDWMHLTRVELFDPFNPVVSMRDYLAAGASDA